MDRDANAVSRLAVEGNFSVLGTHLIQDAVR